MTLTFGEEEITLEDHILRHRKEAYGNKELVPHVGKTKVVDYSIFILLNTCSILQTNSLHPTPNLYKPLLLSLELCTY